MTTEYALESLEPRTLLSATLSRHGVLYVVGTRHADNIVIYTDRRRNPQVVNVYVNHQVQTFAASLVRSVVVQAGGGNDRVTFTDHRGRVPGRHFLYGGAGADCIVDDGGGNDYIDAGGEANDSVSAGGGDDQIIGSPIDIGDGNSSGPTTQPTSGDNGGSGGGGDFGDPGNSDGSGSDSGDSGGYTGGGSGDSGSSGGEDF